MNSDPSPPQHSRPGHVLDPGGRWVWLDAGLVQSFTQAAQWHAKKHHTSPCGCPDCAVADAIQRGDHNRATIYHDHNVTTTTSTPSTARSPHHYAPHVTPGD